MTGDPRVLAGLQQAFNATDDDKVKHAICSAWERETHSWSTVIPFIDERIRDWTPPDAEPSLEQRVAELEGQMSRVIGRVSMHDERFDTQSELQWRRYLEIRKLTGIDPEPTAPDDPVCAREGCGHKRSDHEQGIGLPRFPTNCKRCSCSSFLPAPQAAPDLDPVLLKIAEAHRQELVCNWHEGQESSPRENKILHFGQCKGIRRAFGIVFAHQNPGTAIPDVSDYYLEEGGA